MLGKKLVENLFYADVLFIEPNTLGKKALFCETKDTPEHIDPEQIFYHGISKDFAHDNIGVDFAKEGWVITKLR